MYPVGIEPTTLSLRGNSSTIKLRIQILNQHVKELIFVSPLGLEPRMNIIPRIKSPVPYQFCYEELCLFPHRDSNPTPHFKRVVPTNQFAIGEYVKIKKSELFILSSDFLKVIYFLWNQLFILYILVSIPNLDGFLKLYHLIITIIYLYVYVFIFLISYFLDFIIYLYF